MMKWSILLFVLIAVIACESPTDNSRVIKQDFSIVEKDFLTLDIQSGQRFLKVSDSSHFNFYMHIPTNLDSQNTTLVLALHWAKGNGYDFAEQFVKPAFSGENVLIVAPDGVEWISYYTTHILHSFTELAKKHWPLIRTVLSYLVTVWAVRVHGL